MSTHGKVRESDGHETVWPSWFNNVYRLLKHGLKPGLVCGEDSTLGALTATSSTRATMTTPADDTEVIYSAGCFLHEVNQAYVDFSAEDDAGWYDIVVAAYQNATAAAPRYEIFVRKVEQTDTESALADDAIYLKVGEAYWTGTAMTLYPGNEYIRRAGLGILQLSSLYRGPQALRQFDAFEIGNGARIGPELPGDPDLIVEPTGVSIALGTWLRLWLGQAAEIRLGDYSQLHFDHALLQLVGNSILRLIGSQIDLSSVVVGMSSTTHLRGTSSAYTGTWWANTFCVESFPKVMLRADGDGTIVYSRGVDAVTRTGTGLYTVEFTHRFIDTNYRVKVTPIMPSGSPTRAVLPVPIGFAADQCQLRLTDTADDLTDCAFCLEIHGEVQNPLPTSFI